MTCPTRAHRGDAGMSVHELSDEQREIRDLARRFADEEIAPHAASWDREHRFPREVFRALGELGLMGACVPVEHGGAGADFLSYIFVVGELSPGRARGGRAGGGAPSARGAPRPGPRDPGAGPAPGAPPG